MSNYTDYLASEHWHNFKKQYARSSLPKACRVCFSETDVDLHHMTYRRKGFERLTDVVPLCRKHHEHLHASTLDAGKGGVGMFIHQLHSVFGISRSSASSLMDDWRKPPGKKNKKRMRATKKLERSKRKAIQNRSIHEKRCGKGPLKIVISD